MSDYHMFIDDDFKDNYEEILYKEQDNQSDKVDLAENEMRICATKILLYKTEIDIRNMIFDLTDPDLAKKIIDKFPEVYDNFLLVVKSFEAMSINNIKETDPQKLFEILNDRYNTYTHTLEIIEKYYSFFTFIDDETLFTL